MKHIGSILLSGSLDSTIVAARAKADGYELSAVTVDYGQTHRREIESATRVAGALEIRHQIVRIDLHGSPWQSALTSAGRLPIPLDHLSDPHGRGIPPTYVPLRQALFLTLAGALLESEVLNLVNPLLNGRAEERT
jgi:7-cyano-7-deazaguanine synthase